MFLRLLTVFFIISIFSNFYGSFFVNGEGEVAVKGTPHFQDGTKNNGGRVRIKCRDGTKTSEPKEIKNNNEYKVYVKGHGKTIPEDCNALFTLKFSKSLKSICDANKDDKGSYLICPFSVNISYSFTYE
uniref:ZP domain-containing protein n=1 Tax=Strongyloides papillosus TaxID=174720 RepID=A0A0N5CIS6_STREA